MERSWSPGRARRSSRAYKEIEALWEILSPSPELRDHIATYRRLAGLYAAVRNAYERRTSYVADLASKTRFMVQDSAVQEGLGYLTKTVTFDVGTLEALRDKSGSDEAKVFNLVRGLREEVETEPDMESVLLPLKDRAERILKDLEDRTTTGLAAMDRLAALVREKEAAIEAARASSISPRAFGVHWALKDDPDLDAAGISTLSLAQDADALLGRFPNAAVNADEQRRLRAALYHPLLRLGRDERSRVVDCILAIVLGAGTDADT